MFERAIDSGQFEVRVERRVPVTWEVLRRCKQSRSLQPANPSNTEAGTNVGVGAGGPIADDRIGGARVYVEHRSKVYRASDRGELHPNGMCAPLGHIPVSPARDGTHPTHLLQRAA